MPLLFAMSGTAEPFLPYLQAAGARAGRSAMPRFLPFNTLGQILATEPRAEEPEVFLLFPWDFAPEADWRSGIAPERADRDALLARARTQADRLRRRSLARVVYVQAPIPPTTGTPAGDRALELALAAEAAALGASMVDGGAFALGSYFATGCPIGGPALGRVADAAVEALLALRPAPCKLVVTDFDNALWAGVVAEDGVDGVAFAPEGPGFRHFVYQTLLARLRQEGVLLAGVSRNDPDIAWAPIRSGRMTLREDDFVAVLASYHPKSAQIREIATRLNLGLDAIVFVDDNPVELSEVAQQLPGVVCLPFPTRDEDLPALLAALASRCASAAITAEDRERTTLYRRRLEGLAPVDASAADLTTFLRELDMRLEIHDRTSGDRARAVQLINKTNQFNLNGRRWSDADVADVLARGGKLLGASLTDRSGSHGEILALLVGADDVAEAFVMSCRVFQRRVEHAVLATLVARGAAPASFRFATTERNGPMRAFLSDPAFHHDGPLVALDQPAFADAHGTDRALFDVRDP
jgi:FkbH-like protein